MERNLEKEFEDYFQSDLADVNQTPADISKTLEKIAQETGTMPAVIWAIPREDHLHLVLITPSGEPVVRDLYEVPSPLLFSTAQQFLNEVSQPSAENPLTAGRQLHRWIVAPFESEFLQPARIDTILFCLGEGLRGLPLAALFDGKEFLISKGFVA